MTDPELVEKVGEQLRSKIASKFQTSSFLAGLAVAVLGVQLSNLTDNDKPPLYALSIALMFGAVIIYVAGLVKLDELTMPKRFWEEDTPQAADWGEVVLLKDQDLWELRKRMIFFWYTLTLTATGITGLALLVLLIPAAWLTQLRGARPGDAFVGVIVAIIVTIVYFLVLARIAHPVKIEQSKSNQIEQEQTGTSGQPRNTLREWLGKWRFSPLLRLQD